MRKVNIMPLAGMGKRFLDVGINIPKPLIKINGLPMVVRAAKNLPIPDLWIFICQRDHIENFKIDKVLKYHFPRAIIIDINYLTEGQAVTCLLSKDYLRSEDQLLIGACDNEMVYDLNIHYKSLNCNDALIWTFRKNVSVLNNPTMYGWVKVDNKNLATKVSCKLPISDQPFYDHAVSGTFSFKKAEYFIEHTENIIKMGKKVKNEYYLDTVLDELIKNNYKVAPFEVEKYFCWGTPKDLSTYKKLYE